MNFFLSSFYLAEQPVERSCFVDVCVEHHVIRDTLEEIFSSSSSCQIPLPESSLEIKTRILLETHQHLPFELLVRGQRRSGSTMMNNEVLEGEFFLFSDFAVKHYTDAEKEVLEDEGVNFRLA